MKKHLKLAAVTFLTICFAIAAAAQAQTGAIRVVVKNVSAGIIAGVEVTATHNESGVNAVGWTDSEGTCTFTEIPAGTYSIRVASAGFQTAGRLSTIRPGDEITVGFQLRSTEAEEETRAGSSFRRQVVVIDIPGIETDGRNRPDAWGPVLTGSNNFSRHNIRHEGQLGLNLQRLEPGTTTTLSRTWNETRDISALAPVLADVRAGRDLYVKFDQNIKLPGYLFGKQSESQWVKSSVDSFISQVKRMNPNAEIIVNSHSKGTLDAHALNLNPVSRVYLASDRGSVNDIQRLAKVYPNTKFTVVAADRDFAHGIQGFMKVNAPNVTVMNLKNGGLLPTTVHGQVTDPAFRGVFDIKTQTGTQRISGTLGDLIRQPAAFDFKAALPGARPLAQSQPVLRGFDPGGILIPTSIDYEADASGITQGLRNGVRKPE